MDPASFALAAFGIAAVAGVLGAMFGLGGGVIVVPALTLLLGVDIRFAIGASIVAVIATSSGAAAAYVRDGLSNVRVALFLEVATVAGAITGAFVAGLLSATVLTASFGLVLIVSAVGMLRVRHDVADAVTPDRVSRRLRLGGSYFDQHQGRRIDYEVTRAPLGFGIMYVAGATSGLLGLGGGVFKVPAMDLAMRMPIKASTATSNFMMGATAAASAGVYFSRGEINPFIAAPVALGILAGALIGARVLPRIDNQVVRLGFVGVLTVVGVQMILKAF